MSSEKNTDEKEDDWIVLRLVFSRYTNIEEHGCVDVRVPREIVECVGADTGVGILPTPGFCACQQKPQ